MSVAASETFTVDGHEYQSTRMSAFDQHAVASKLGGILLLMFDNMKKDKSMGADQFSRAFAVLSGDMRKSEMDLVFDLCLSGVTRSVEGGQGWAKVMTDQPGVMAYSDIDMPQMLEIMWKVLQQHRIPDFFAAPPSSSKPGTRGEKSTS
jgi:hypothetical protein